MIYLIDNKISSNKKSSYNYSNRMLILSRPSMVNISKNIKTIDISHKFYLIEESSDNEDGYNEDTKHTMPSLMKVSKNIFDPNLIMILTDIKYFPKEAEPGLIITGIEDWVTEKYIKYFLKGVPSLKGKSKEDDKNINFSRLNDTNDLEINSIKFFTEQNKRYAYIKLNNYNQMEIIGNFFLNPIKKLYPSYNSLKEKIEVYFAYDLLKLTKNHWYGVILRNLPEKCSDKSIYDFTDQKVKNGIKYCLNPICIDNVYCALVVCKELEFAEKLCHELNNTPTKNNYIKAHLHPQICKIRNENFFNDYETINKEGYIFSEDAEQSEKCLSFAKPFMEFFYPDYLNSFNNNKSKKKENKNTIDENMKKNKEKEKNIKREKDLILANSILDLIKKSKSIEDFNKVNNQNSKSNNLINNNNEQTTQNNDNTMEMQSSEKLLPMSTIKSSIIHQNSNDINLEFNQSSSKILSEINEANIIKDKNNIIINTEIKELDKENKEKDKEKQKNEEKNENEIKYSQDEINYYTYNMGDQKFYNDLEIQQQRKASSFRPRNTFKDDYKSYHSSNTLNREYRSQRYEPYNRINSSPDRRQYNTSYKKFYKGYSQYSKERDYHYNRNYENFKERSKEKDRERSRENEREKSKERNNGDEWKKFRDEKDKRYNNYNYNSDLRKEKDKEWDKEKDLFRERDNDRGYNREKDKELDKEKDRLRERNWDREREERGERTERDRERTERGERDRDREVFIDDRNKRNNNFRFYERNDRNDRNERNYNNYNERRKDSRLNDNRQRNDKDRRERDRYYNNGHYYNKF